MLPIRARARALVLAALLVAASCGGRASTSTQAPQARPTTAAITAPVAPAPAHRLSDAAKPLVYRLDLHVDPTKPTFAGVVEIDVAFATVASSVWLNAEGLAFASATVTPADGRPIVARRLLSPAGPTGLGLLGLGFERPIPAGAATLRIEYTGAFREQDGLFRQSHGWASYAFTDFEPIDARRAFPCFDDPRFKTPFTVSLTVPSDQRAFSNTAIATEQPAADSNKRVTFAQTRPLPTYLIAWAVGPFAVVDGPQLPIPIRAITFPGMEQQVQLALEMAGALLPLAQSYLDRPIPFGKLDLIAVPSFDGAMENPGLVTIAARILHVDADDPPPRAARLLALVIAHEIAHYWFGDLVTMSWWDDLWLNEGFATWMASKLLDQWKPRWRWPLEDRLLRSSALAADRAPDARAIRQPITSDEAIRASFDAITYLKGGAVVGMLEHWVGETAFRRALQTYLDAHAWGSATTQDLVRAIESASTEPVAAVVRDFTERAGVPDIEVESHCDHHRGFLLFRQRTPKPWRVPLCARIDRSQAPVCTVLGQRETVVQLGTCATAVYPNTGERAYALARHRGLASGLTPIERLGALEVVLADAESRELDPAAVGRSLGSLGTIASASEARMLAYVADRLRVLGLLTLAEIAPEIERLAGARARSLGLARRAAEPAEQRLERLAIARLVGVDGGDRVLRRDARKRLTAWFADKLEIDDELFGDVVAIAAAGGDAALFDAIVSAIDKSGDDSRRAELAAGLAYFETPALIDRALELARGGTLGRGDAVYLLYRLTRAAHARTRAWAYIDRHRVVLASAGLLFPSIFDGGCSNADLEIAERALAGTSHEPEKIRETLEEIRACLTVRRNEKRVRARVPSPGVNIPVD